MRGFARALLSLRGRLTRPQFWLGFFVVFVGGAFASRSPGLVGTILTVLVLYTALCVYGKRLHDFGKSAWYMVAPIAGTLCVYAYLAAALSRTARGSFDQSGFQQARQSIVVGNVILLMIWVATSLLVGLRTSQKGDNRFGMDPREVKRIPTAPPHTAS